MQNIFLPKLMGLQEGTTELFVHVGVHPVFGRDKLKGTKKEEKNKLTLIRDWIIYTPIRQLVKTICWGM